MALQITDLLAMAGIIDLPRVPFVVAGALALFKSDIRDLRTETRADMEGVRAESRASREDLCAEIRAVDAKVESLARVIGASPLAGDLLAAVTEAGASSPTRGLQPRHTANASARDRRPTGNGHHSAH